MSLEVVIRDAAIGMVIAGIWGAIEPRAGFFSMAAYGAFWLLELKQNRKASA